MEQRRQYLVGNANCQFAMNEWLSTRAQSDSLRYALVQPAEQDSDAVKKNNQREDREVESAAHHPADGKSFSAEFVWVILYLHERDDAQHHSDRRG